MKTFNFVYRGKSSLKKICLAPEFQQLRARASACLAQVYSGRIDPEALGKTGREILDLLPEARVIGATSAGEILDGRITDHQTVVSISFFEKATVSSRLWDRTQFKTDEELGREIGSSVTDKEPRLMFLFSTALTVEGGALVRGIWTKKSKLLIAGGGAGDNNHMKQCFVLHGTEVSDSAAVTASLHGAQLEVWCRQSLGWQAVGKKMTLDQVEGKRLVRIDGEPAGKIYDRYLGVEVEDGRVSERAREFPLIINRNGLEISRIAAYRLPDGSLAFPSDLREGEQAQFSVANIETMLETARTMVDELCRHPIESAFIFSCTVRRGALQSVADQETVPLADVGALAGFYTYGEYFHHPQCNQVLNGAMSVVGLSEATASPSKKKPRRATAKIAIPSSVRVFATMANLIQAVQNTTEGWKEKTPANDFIFLNTGEEGEKVFLTDIIAVRAEGNYTRLFLRDAQPVLVRLTMKKWESLLPRELFLKLHRSLVVQIRQIKRWEMRTRETGHLQMEGIPEPMLLSRQSLRLLRQLK